MTIHFLKWLYPGMKFKRWLLLFSIGVIAVSLGLAMVFNYKFIGVVEEFIFRVVYRATGTFNYAVTTIVGALVIVLGVLIMTLATRKMIHSIISILVPGSSDKLVELAFHQRRLKSGPSIVVIGGGTGLSVLLRGLKNLTSNITAVVTVSDDGGSSGRLREELGMIPPGDLRSCLVALADTEPLMEKLFQHRFGGSGGLAGHSFGNLFIAAMSQVLGDTEKALKESSKVLKVRGSVLPASNDTVRLVAEMSDGSLVEGESNIPQANKKIHRVRIVPEGAIAVQAAMEAIADADAVVLGPGSLYTSVIPNLLVKGIEQAVRESQAMKIYICNVMTQPGETDGYGAAEHVQAIIDHTGPGMVDWVIVNNQSVAEELRGTYSQQKAYPVTPDVDQFEKLGVQVMQTDLISETNLVRHDPIKLSRAVMALIYNLDLNSNRMRLLNYYLVADNIKDFKND